jgi:hypothetical protein
MNPPTADPGYLCSFPKYPDYSNIAQIMQDYNGLVLEYWSIGVMECWSDGLED